MQAYILKKKKIIFKLITAILITQTNNQIYVLLTLGGLSTFAAAITTANKLNKTMNVVFQARFISIFVTLAQKLFTDTVTYNLSLRFKYYKQQTIEAMIKPEVTNYHTSTYHCQIKSLNLGCIMLGRKKRMDVSGTSKPGGNAKHFIALSLSK